MKKLNVIFYARKVEPPQWLAGTKKAFDSCEHDLRIYDHDKSMAEQFADVDVVLDQGGWGTRKMMDAAPNVKLWQIVGTGLDHTDIPYLKSKGIMVANCPGQFSGIGLAECAMMYILNLTRQYNTCFKNFKKGTLYKPFGKTLQDMTLAIIGLGSSGQELAARAKPFGMRVEAIDIVKPSPEIINEIQPDFIGTPVDLDDVIKRCDFLSLHLHVTEDTRHIINARRINMMKQGSFIINVARGALIDEDAMCKALLEGKLAGAGLDVFEKEPPATDNPAWNLPNVFVTPHIAGTTDDTVNKRVAAALDNCNRIAVDKEPLYRVDNI